MSGASESKPLNGKSTILDAFGELKKSISDANLRHTLEGAVIIASPSMLNIQSGLILGCGDVHDSRYKLKIAQTIKDALFNYSSDSNVLDNPRAEIDRLLDLPAFSNYPGYGQKILNLPFVALQIYNKVSDIKKPLLCKRVGEITEKGLNSFYINRGYKLNMQERPGNVVAYLISEYEFFTRITAETSNRARKLF